MVIERGATEGEMGVGRQGGRGVVAAAVDSMRAPSPPTPLFGRERGKGY